ncbi:hypothetical protein [Lishizhenia sp.]|uniref:hypothetical protein n=1 Tax=Lishizhenia sp. TaxID=2497594 RepID=UPI00299E432D|nr:hypothetical protein [Lishizhenia sp.]MDX1444630.1 hypothetical protein [Lishizhenia sp.]
MKIITKVEDLSRSEMIYIYHHISVGKSLDLLEVENNPSKFIVMYKGFNLGYILLPSSLNLMEQQLKKLKAKVSHFTKKKFMPIQGLDIELSCNEA